jgi:exoribonuclease II
MVATLASNGEVWSHLQDDVMFAISNFIDPIAAEQCMSNKNPGEESSSSPDSWMSPHTLAARVKVLKELRRYEKQVETHYHIMAMRIQRVLEDMPWAKSDSWAEITTTDVAEAVGARSSLERFCVHKFLMSRHERFIAHSIDFLSAQRFWVRPLAQVEDLKTISQMLARDDPALHGFYEKARDLVQAHRAGPSYPTTLSSAPITSVSWTPAEQTIIRFLQAFIRSTRTTQKDPYVIPVATLIKRLGLYDGFVRTDQSLVQQFLADIGAVAPWDDFVTKDRDLLCLPSSVKVPAPSTPLGPDEFYPYDTVENVRHDFKNLNAYVIDDVGAQELDDAVSVERIPSEPDSAWVHVHIADPTFKLHPNHILSREARLKFSTAYNIHETIPMLPQSIMYDGLSLGTRSKQGLPENVLSFSFKVDGQGNIGDYKVRAGLLRNVHVIKYDDVDTSLGRPPRKVPTPFDLEPYRYSTGTTLPPKQTKELRLLHEVMRKLVARRMREDIFFFSVPNSHVSMDRTLPSTPADLSHPFSFKGFPKLNYELESQEFEYLGARQMVSECMQGACRVASRFFRDNGIPAIRRVAGSPKAGTGESLDNVLKQRREDGMIPATEAFRIAIDFPRGENTLELGSHFSIGSKEGEGYVRVTSPLRRYGDLVHHWQIKHALATTGSPAKPFFSRSWLQSFVEEMTNKEQGLKAIERRHQRYWALKFMEQWLVNPENKDRPNPLAEMEAILMAPIDFDVMYRNPSFQVYVPSLGLGAMGDYLGERMTAPSPGDIIRVKLDEIRLGTAPALVVTAGRTR